MTPTTLTPLDLMDRLATHYDFEDNGTGLATCPEWQQLRDAIIALDAAAVQRGRVAMLREVIERFRTGDDLTTPVNT